ncbi:MAG: hypothetical protein FJX31_11460 [Alphaproteobacteria bacterium]|nr:hypothetical protein [Alphaproteobacteria bacterium]
MSQIHVHHHGPGHTHDHGHDHSHDHNHGAPHALPAARAAEPGFSLLRLSALQRLAGVAALLALLWIAVAWALS